MKIAHLREKLNLNATDVQPHSDKETASSLGMWKGWWGTVVGHSNYGMGLTISACLMSSKSEVFFHF